VTSRDKFNKGLLSYLRVVAAATAAVVLGAILSPSFNFDDPNLLKGLLSIAFGAAVKWTIDYLRKSNTDFGVGSEPATDAGTNDYEQLEFPVGDE